jgi:cytochrome c
MTLIAATVLLGPGAALAQEEPEAGGTLKGDPVAGEEHFQRQCIACHVVQDDEGEVLAGRNARVGPNLYGVIGRVAGSYPDYDYSELMELYGPEGEEAVWEEENFVGYVQDPTGFLREATGEDSGRSKMAYQVRDEQEAYDLHAYLATFSPPETAEGEGDGAGAAGDGEAAEGEAAEGEDASE